jgi:hypothetical protein
MSPVSPIYSHPIKFSKRRKRRREKNRAQLIQVINEIFTSVIKEKTLQKEKRKRKSKEEEADAKHTNPFFICFPQFSSL